MPEDPEYAKSFKKLKESKSCFKTIDRIPTRADFVDKTERKKIDECIKTGKALDFMPVSVAESLPFRDYEIHLHGALISGDKATVIVKNVPLFFDLRLPNGKQAKLFMNDLKIMLSKAGCIYTKIESHIGRYPFEFDIKDTYYRIYFKKMQDRKKAIEYFQHNKYKYTIFDKEGNSKKVVEEKYQTAFDDQTHHYRKACREGDDKLSLIDWNIIKTYVVDKSKTNSKAPYLIKVDSKNIRWNNVDKKKPENKKYADDKTLVLCFDFETHSYSTEGGAPLPDDQKAETFQCGISCFWRSEKVPFYKIGVCTKDMTERPYDVIKCKTEKDLIIAIYQIIEKFQPDFISEFNGGGYDWPWLISRTDKYGLFATAGKCLSIMREVPNVVQMKKWNVRKVDIKLDAERKMTCINMRFPGYECIDTCIKFRQLFKNDEEYSLKYFLAKCKLPSKDPIDHIMIARRFKNSDMDEDTVKEYVKSLNNDLKGDELKKECEKFIETAKKEMAEVMDYCIVDSDRCQLLMLNKNLIPDMREVGIRSFTTMYDGIYIADGMKVTNLILHCAFKAGLEFSTIVDRTIAVDPDFQFIGAYVVEPETGLENKRPVTGLDFASLYPSLIRTYNFSPEYIVTSKERKEKLEKEGHKLHHIKFPGPKGTTIEGWTVWHENKPEKTGIYATILGELFDARKVMKAEIKPYAEKMEHIGKEMTENKKKQDDSNTLDKEVLAKKYEEMSIEYEEVKKIFDYVNAKQKALKVFMNTFYGLMGFSQSPLFRLLLAGGVTTSGRANLEKVHKFCTEHGYKVKYGDTDSLYITPPDSVYVEEDELFRIGKITKIEYWTRMVQTTMKELNEFKDKVAAFLKADNGTGYLAMAYEEVLFPVVFLAKKMYFGIPHEGVVNFKPPKLFIRGIANIKRGFPQFIKTMIGELQWSAMDINNELDLKDLVVSKFEELTKREWKLSDFAQSAEWRPKKAQPTLQTFIARLPKKDRPKPNERVHFLVVDQNPYYTSIDGKKVTKKKGEMMELLQVAEEQKMKPNLLFYISGFAGSGGTAIGQFARFISWHKEFDVPFDKKRDKDKKYMKTIDNKRMSKAKAYLKKIAAKLLTGYKFDSKSSKFVYTQVVDAIRKTTDEMYGSNINILSKLRDDPIDDFKSSAIKEAQSLSTTKAFKTRVFDAVDELCKKHTPHELDKLYVKNDRNILRMRNQYIKTEIQKIIDESNIIIPKLSKLAKKQNKQTKNIILKLRKEVGIDDNKTIKDYGEAKFAKALSKETKKIVVPEGYKEDLKKLTKLHERYVSMETLKRWNAQLVNRIEFKKKQKSGDDEPMEKVELAKKADIKKIVSGIDIPLF
jgi:DNA polymerase elongation subunit (family B)